MSADDAKEGLRRGTKFHLAGLSPAEFHKEGAKAAALLRRSPLWTSYKTILLFLSMPAEIDTDPILEAAFGDHKQVFAPRTEEALIRFYRVASPQGPWQYGFFGLREPAEGEGAKEGKAPPETGALAEDTPQEDALKEDALKEDALKEHDFPALVITPGLAFDRLGRRLGRGGGYYDRFFAGLDAAGREYTALGLCLDCQIVDQVPAEEHDRKMDMICTGTKIILPA